MGDDVVIYISKVDKKCVVSVSMTQSIWSQAI